MNRSTTGAPVLERPRLVARLERLRADGEGQLLLLAAPPGFGKTTLVQSWLRTTTSDVPVALSHLRDVGGSRRVLWQRVLAAVAEVVDASLAEAVTRLPVPDRIGHDDFVTELLDLLGGVRLVLVLDDVHEATDVQVLRELDRLVARAPGSLRLVLLSRSRPPLPSLTDRRLRGELEILAAAELAFTAAETADVSAHLPPERRQQVWSRTEGWPAMVRLMTLALEQEGPPDDPGWPADGGLADRLFGEVFRGLDPAAQHVLLQCAVADPTPLDLLVELTEREDAGDVIAAVGDWSGLLRTVTWRDGEPAYRLHPILRAHLRGELLRRDTPAARGAEGLCARWFLDRGEALVAVRHAVESGSMGVLERTLAAGGLGVVADGHAGQLVSVLGARLFRGRIGPWTAVVGTAALAEQGRTTEAATLHEVHAPAHDRELATAQHAVGALLRRRRGHPSSAPVDPPEEVSLDVDMVFSLHRGAELLRAGELVAAGPLLQRAVDVATGRGHDALLVDALSLQAAHAAASGDFAALRRRLDRARDVAEVGGWTGAPRAALLHMLQGWVAYLDLDDVRARTLSARASEVLDPEDDPSTVVSVRNLELGVVEGASLRDTQWVHDSWTAGPLPRLAPDLVAGVALADAQVNLHTGRVDRLREVVERLLDRMGPTAETRLAGAYLALARGRPEQAGDTLAPVLAGEVEARWPLTPLDARVLMTRLDLAQDRHFQAVAELRAALDLAAAAGSPRSLLGLGRDGLDLLAQGRGSWGVHEQLAGRVLAYVAAGRDPVPVLLTDREVDVLRELPTLRTVEEIAADMVISVNTLKTHLRSIYRKLGVSSRREAVSEARRAGLV